MNDNIILGSLMHKKLVAIYLLFFSLTGCVQSKMSIEYDKLTKSGLQGQELFVRVNEFELQNPLHFESKVDLAGYYALTGDYDQAWQYLKRAESVLSQARKNSEGKKAASVMYGSLAEIAFFKKDYVTAENYAQKAVSHNKQYGKEYRYLQGQIALAQDKKEEALRIFDEAYAQMPEKLTADDMHAYMYLLADSERTAECRNILELYFETGSFFAGLGMFASSVYESLGESQKAVLSAFLDYEYYASYNESDDSEFVANLNTLEAQLKTNGFDAALPTLTLVRSLYNKNIEPPETIPDFFIAKYCLIKRHIQYATVTLADFNALLSLERYFSNFPVYYWLVWQCAMTSDVQTRKNYIPVLKKIISLSKNGPYAIKARLAICETLGIDSGEAEKIDSLIF